MELGKLLQQYWFELNHDWISSGIFTACTTKFLSENFAENKSKFLKLLVPVGFGESVTIRPQNSSKAQNP